MPLCFIESIVVDQHLGQLIVDLFVAGVELEKLLKSEDRLLVLAGHSVGVRQVDDGQLGVGLQAQRLFVAPNGIVDPVNPALLVAKAHPCVDDRRVLLENLLEGLDRGLGIVVVQRCFAGATHEVVQVDLVLGIGERDALDGFVGVGNEIPEIAERGQSGAGVGVDLFDAFGW